jgi:hypothetical protein
MEMGGLSRKSANSKGSIASILSHDDGLPEVDDMEEEDNDSVSAPTHAVRSATNARQQVPWSVDSGLSALAEATEAVHRNSDGGLSTSAYSLRHRLNTLPGLPRIDGHDSDSEDLVESSQSIVSTDERATSMRALGPDASSLVFLPGKKQFHLFIQQQPIHVRKCSVTEKDKKVIDPPPIVRVRVSDENGKFYEWYDLVGVLNN